MRGIPLHAVTLSCVIFAEQKLVLQGGAKHNFHLEGAPAAAVLITILAIIVAFIVRFMAHRRSAGKARLAQGAAEAEIRTLLKAMTDVVLVVNGDGICTRIPETNADVRYQLSRDMAGRHVRDILPERTAGTVATLSAQVARTQTPAVAEFSLDVDDAPVWFAATASPLDSQSVLWVARDITDTKVARDALVQSEVRYRQLFNRNPCAMWVYDFDTRRIVEVNEAAVAQYGYSREEFARMTLDDLRSPGEVEHLSALLNDMPVDQLSIHVVKHQKKGGAIIDADVRGHPLGIPSRRLRLIVSTDITERLAAERVVREAESRAIETSQMLQALIDAAPQPMIVMSPDWLVTRWNDASAALFGWSADEVVGAQPPFIPEECIDRATARRRMLSQGAVEKPTETVRLRKDGKRVDVMLAMSPLLDLAGTPTAYIAVYMDLTERKLLEEQLRQSQKMEAIGTLAGGVAHDFNNILTVISSYSSMLLTDDRYPDIRGDIEEISTAARRATGLTRQLLTFSRKAIVQLQPVDLNTVVGEMEPMLRRLLMEHIDLIFKLTEGVSTVTADVSQIEQILLNLTVNAADAMPEGGTLVIETHNVSLDGAYAEMHTGVQPGPYVLLAVTDSGTGMDAETIRKIFEPFFTTKEVGRGTGLGLATIYAIVKQLGGHIWVYSEPGQGAAFKVYLPRDMSTAAAEVVPVQASRTTASGTVLLVEDDDAVRRAARRMLEKAGFEVIEAQDGEQGLSVASSFEGEIAVVVTDLMMPRMNGGDFAAALAQIHPRSRVVFTSGYTDDSVLRRRLVDATHAFVQKPFTGDQLVRTITSLLDSPVPGWPAAGEVA